MHPHLKKLKSPPPYIAPSILSADFSKLGEEVESVVKGGTRFIHVDVMDGHFVPNLTLGAPIVKSLHQAQPDVFLDCHLMVSEPQKWVKDFAKAGADCITVHAEASIHLDRLVRSIRDEGCMAGVSLNPATPLVQIEEILDKVDLVLLMSVNPGFGGQSFIESTLKKCEHLVQMRKSLGESAEFLIEVDGGINKNNAGRLFQAGCDVFVAGSAVFGQTDRGSAIRGIVEEFSP